MPPPPSPLPLLILLLLSPISGQHLAVSTWDTSESLETSKGQVPTISCPIGTYREYGTNNLARPVGQRHDGCEPCPRGRYGTSTDLANAFCSGYCPKGRYRDQTGGSSLEDCEFCPEGTYGNLEGLTDRHCSGECTDKNTASTVKATNHYYSDVKGLTRIKDCKTCKKGYRGWQCDWDIIPRLGSFSSADGRINEAAHQYLMEGTDGEWSADKKAGDYAGAWPAAGAYPDNAPIYPGRIPWDTMNEGFTFDPAATERVQAQTPVP